MYPQNIGSDVKLNLLQRRVSCHYVHVLMNTAIARKETESAKKVPLTITNQSQIQTETKKKLMTLRRHYHTLKWESISTK
jgi:hypothetical protein